MKNTVVNWNAGFPENVLTDPVQIFAAEYFRVLVTGRYQSDGMLCVEIVNRMKRKTTGVQELDTSNALGVPPGWRMALADHDDRGHSVGALAGSNGPALDTVQPKAAGRG